jgi:hypothetical protein
MARQSQGSTDEAVETLLFVEFLDGRPHSIVTSEATYDVYWSNVDGCLYSHRSGGGGYGHEVYDGWTWWAADGQTIRHRNRQGHLYEPEPGMACEDRLVELPEEWSDEAILDVVQNDETDCQWCSACDSWIATTDYGDHPCDHIHWCDSVAWWSTPDERCDPGCLECLEVEGATRAETCPLGLIGEGHGHVSQDWWSEHTGHYDRRDPGEYFYLDVPKWWTMAIGYGYGAIESFERMIDD